MNKEPQYSVEAIGAVVRNTDLPLKQRFGALTMLRNLGGRAAIDQISLALGAQSPLLKHEAAYCLGQMEDSAAIPSLVRCLEDRCQEPIVRHEAGQALGTIGDPSTLPVLQKYCSDPVKEVAETCELAVARIHWFHSQPLFAPRNADTAGKLDCRASAGDPAPASKIRHLGTLKCRLLNEKLALFDRYRVMYRLRDIGGEEAALALAEGLRCKGALFRHEIAYVLGQLAEPATVNQLSHNLQDLKESPMVRHECAEALGCIGTEACLDVLERYRTDGERVVQESCQVALDMCEYRINPSRASTV